MWSKAYFVCKTSSDEVTLFQQHVPAVMVKIEQIAAVNQEKAVVAVDI